MTELLIEGEEVVTSGKRVYPIFARTPFTRFCKFSLIKTH